ncbi:MAG: HAMP domain-containing histidine kinase [Oscillospiraceae bacterium]|nr:HAMP domain-containing histidine kinase [Oscillospiraceae bacterium]
MLIKKSEIIKLSADIRKIIDGQSVDLRDNSEGVWKILKNDIHTLASIKNEQVDSLGRERDVMSDTLANISHQLKTPLTSMMLMADLLDNSLSEKQDKQIEFISNIKTGLTRMEWLVSALLKMAKLDAGAIEFSMKNIQTNELLNLALEPLQILLDVKNQSVEILSETDVSELFCDKKWTSEALSNVIKNASEYSPEGGIISIKFGINPIFRWISVTDSGTGIAKNEIANLFKRFEGSRSEKGYGIGLPLALAIMRGQNGDIEVDAGGGSRGATFTLKFYK